jgi:alpha-galactosidase
MKRDRISALAFTLFCMVVCPYCSRDNDKQPAIAQPSNIQVTVSQSGPLVVRTSAAEFQVLSSGHISGSLLANGTKLTLEDPAASDGNYIVSGGKKTSFTLDLSQAHTSESQGKLGRGKRIEIPGRASTSDLQETLILEAYDDFPGVLLSGLQLKNGGSSDAQVERVVAQPHQLSAKSESKKTAYDMWSFHGSSEDWGKNDVVKLAKGFSQENVMGAINKGGYGGGIPVVAFWTASVGEAIGHVETLPLTLSLPVKVEKEGLVATSVDIPANTTLKPGESYSTPRTFLAVYAGDYYEPLSTWSSILRKEGWSLPKPSNEAYNVSWCGWGYEFNVTPAQMVGTIPKLKEFGIKWATLDDRWFDTYGDWNPRAETFPGDSIKKMVADFHKQGELVQLWWLPLGVEDGQGRWESHKYIVSKVVQEHPDWLILTKEGKHARMTRDLAALDPALPEVQAYFKQLTEKFIRDWDFDGSKLDNIYTVPACYNPAHHHKSPQDSINAMGEVYKTIFQTTRAIKPESVTQACPCGTPPSLAWLPFIDQAVTADPVGAVQVRRRIKMYKALLGPESAVYGDHVELSEMTKAGNSWDEHGGDFASTIGTGGVVGTKFVMPTSDPKFKRVALTPEKDERWKKWIGIYNDKMLSKGTFRNLYVYGYDTPEGYAIEKDGKMYYAFFAADPSKGWKGKVELRGLSSGTYHVLNYDDGKDLGTITSDGVKAPEVSTEFKNHLLLEVSK